MHPLAQGGWEQVKVRKGGRPASNTGGQGYTATYLQDQEQWGQAFLCPPNSPSLVGLVHRCSQGWWWRRLRRRRGCRGRRRRGRCAGRAPARPCCSPAPACASTAPACAARGGTCTRGAWSCLLLCLLRLLLLPLQEAQGSGIGRHTELCGDHLCVRPCGGLRCRGCADHACMATCCCCTAWALSCEGGHGAAVAHVRPIQFRWGYMQT